MFKKIIKILYFKYFNHGNQVPMICYNDFIGKHILFDNFYEKEDLILIQNSFSNEIKKSSFIDIGSNVGNHTIFFRNTFKNIYCFEPQKITYKILTLNTEPFEHIKTFNYGIDIQKKEVTFYIPTNNNGMGRSSVIEGKNIRKESVLLKPIDDSLIKNVGFVKIDVEGNEYSVLQSLKKIINKDKPIIGIELNYDNPNKNQILEFLFVNNYKTFMVNSKIFNNRFKSYLNILGRKNKLVKVEIETLKKMKRHIPLVICINNNSKYNLKQGNE
jgi:FkbM family methyltransferase